LSVPLKVALTALSMQLSAAEVLGTIIEPDLLLPNTLVLSLQRRHPNS